LPVTLASTNNPSADANGNVTVRPGNRIPLNPAQQGGRAAMSRCCPGCRWAASWCSPAASISMGTTPTRTPKLPSYAVVNMRVSCDISEQWQVFGLVDNLFDNHAATYGTYFEPDDTTGLVTPALSDPRSVTLQQPISFQAGVKMKF
jgi:iron complex outermembrane receptor protein